MISKEDSINGKIISNGLDISIGSGVHVGGGTLFIENELLLKG